jgi:hypothetical protein
MRVVCAMRMATIQTGIRFTDEDRAVLDALRAKLGLGSRTDVVRLALRRLAELEKVEVSKLKPVHKH